MSDFETLYDEKLSSLQENEIVDDYFVSVLHSQDFVALLKGLYESSDETETSSIYLHCVEQGFRVCDLQRALCYLNDEWLVCIKVRIWAKNKAWLGRLIKIKFP